MDLILLLISLGIFTETSFLLFKKFPRRSIKALKIYIDTSALMDGRILEIAKTGFISDELVILTSVLHELQLLADGKDATKRQLARKGLEIASDLERVENATVEIEDDLENIKGVKVDNQLLKVAKLNHDKILTLDYNLIKLAAAEKIATLNINDLALAARRAFTPGEIISAKIAEKGTGRGQGVAYLPDSTMVVVERAASEVGQTLDIELTKVRETSSGRMIFAKIKSDNPQKDQTSKVKKPKHNR